MQTEKKRQLKKATQNKKSQKVIKLQKKQIESARNIKVF